MKILVKIQKNLGISGYCGLIHLSVTGMKFEKGIGGKTNCYPAV